MGTDDKDNNEFHLDGNEHADQSKNVPPPSEISTYRKHSMDYFTRDGVILRTGFSNLRDWFLLCIKELLDNAVDFLVRNYQAADNCIIAVEIFKDDNFFHLKVRNSNYNNCEAFMNKPAIFNYDGRYGSKQDLHIISRGMLGDAQKQILAFGYILIHLHDDGSEFKEKQWNKPLIIRHNGKEYKIYLKVDKARQVSIVSGLDQATGEVQHTDTEIELTLPIPDEIRNDLNRKCIENFCKKYPLFTTDITFKFQITDNSSYGFAAEEPAQISDLDSEIPRIILTTIADESPRATLNIEYNALHPISREPWYKQNSVHSYTAEEFKRRIVNMDSKQAKEICVYDFLATYREGRNSKKTSENQILVAELLLLPDGDRDKKIELFYNQLKAALPPLVKLALPYTTNKEERKNALIARCNRLYGNLDKDKSKAAYRAIHGKYEDKKRKISYPYCIEILAIPFDDPRSAGNNVEFIGVVNFSISPKEDSNLFEGDYSQYLTNDAYSKPRNILGVLQNFGFHDYANDTAKIPCLIVVNLVTHRRDPHGQDKSRIDITPFAGTIVDAVRKLASDIKSYRAVGIRFSKPSERRVAVQVSSGRGLLEGVLTDYLQKNHGL
ncbi:MAG: hypothetical protein WA941_20240 [Nitrososphaeraceae archaeon]